MKLAPKFRSIIGSDLLNSKWKFPDHLACEVYGILWGMPVVNLENADSGGIVYRRVLISFHLLATFIDGKDFHIYLNVVLRLLHRTYQKHSQNGLLSIPRKL
jgi:hypothetical protein